MTELGAAWVLDEAAALDNLYRRALSKTAESDATAMFAKDMAAGLSMLPSDYVKRNCWFGTPLNSEDIEAAPQLGVDNIMWGSDFPHYGGTCPFTIEALRVNFAALPEHQVRQMVSTNAATVYDLDLGFLQGIADRIGPTVAEIARPLPIDEMPTASVCPTFRPILAGA